MRRPWVRWALAALAVVWLGIAAVPMIAAAQRTGGSFGGGSFGGGGGGGSFGGGGGSFGGGSSYSGGGYSGGYSGGGYRYSGGGGGCFTCGSPVIFIAVILLLHFLRARGGTGIGGTGLGAPTHGARGWGQVDISAIRLGVDWRARRELQAQLDRLARSGQTGTPAGLANLLRETVLALRRCELSWLYCEISNYHPMSSAMAEGIFRQLTTDARARFREELVRNADGTTSTRDAQAMKARTDEGEGVVVVTLVVASRREIVDIHEIQDANRIKTLLDDMVASANPQSLVAMEVIWSPAQEDDRMSTAELEQFYPTLRKIDERSIAGRVFCAYCRGPFAMELLTCPHCGAPAPGTENRGQPR